MGKEKCEGESELQQSRYQAADQDQQNGCPMAANNGEKEVVF
jgi:hypothetical protein